MTSHRLALLGALLFGAAAPVSAQSGTGYLFGEPNARLSIRAGYAHASAKSDLFDFVTDKLTLDRGNFGGPSIGAEAGFTVAPRLDLALSADFSSMSKDSEDRGYLDQNNQPIEQTTTFARVPLMVSARLYLTPRGRSVGRLAWIPSKIVPWIGAGGGAMWYRFRQEGDFVDYQTCDPIIQTCNIFNARVETSGWAPAVQGMGGVDVSISPRFAVTADARYTWAHAKPGRDFSDLDTIDLSGVTGALGFTIRL